MGGIFIDVVGISAAGLPMIHPAKQQQEDRSRPILANPGGTMPGKRQWSLLSPFITENVTAALRQQSPGIRSDSVAMISRASTQKRTRPNAAQEQEHP